MLDLTGDDVTESCGICLEDVPQHEVHVIGGCLHRFCMLCLQSHTLGKLKEKCYPIPCPSHNCSAGISNAECNMILRSSQDRQLLAEVWATHNGQSFCALPSTKHALLPAACQPEHHHSSLVGNMQHAYEPCTFTLNAHLPYCMNKLLGSSQAQSKEVSYKHTSIRHTVLSGLLLLFSPALTNQES